VACNDPVFIIWQAINLLAEVNARLDAPESTERIQEAEAVLLNLMLDLWQNAERQSAAEQVRYAARILH